MLDKYVQLPVFTQCLPMNANNGMSRFLFRTKTVTTDQAAVLLPIFGEWKGTGTGHLLMSSRNGQIMSFSLHDTGSNKNCVVAAQSGSGKSFFINELIVSYLSEGAQIGSLTRVSLIKSFAQTLRETFYSLTKRLTSE